MSDTDGTPRSSSPFSWGPLAALLLSLGCGDPARSTTFVGAPQVTIEARLAAPLPGVHPGREVALRIDGINPRGHWLSAPDGQRNGRAPLHLEMEIWPSQVNDDPSPSEGGGPSMYREAADGTVVTVHAFAIGAAPSLRDGEPWVAGPHAIAPDHLLLWADVAARDVQLLGPRGPRLDLEQGYQVVRRICAPDAPVRFVRAAPGEVVELVPLEPGAPTPEADLAARCRIALPAEDLGRELAHPSRGGRTSGLSWAPSGERLYFTLGARREKTASEVAVADVASGEVRTLAYGNFAPLGLEVGADGTALFARMLHPRGGENWQIVESPTVPPQDGAAGVRPTDLLLPLAAPDGRTLAHHQPQNDGAPPTILLRDLATREDRVLSRGKLVAWAPDAQSALVAPGWPGSEGLVQLGLDGAAVDPPLSLATRFLQLGPDPRAHARFAWIDGAPIGIDQPSHETIVARNLRTGAGSRLLATDERQAPGSTIEVGGEHAFIWTYECASFSDRFCTARLLRISLRDEGRKIVAIARAPRPFAVSRDGRRLAIGGDTGSVYVKDL